MRRIVLYPTGKPPVVFKGSHLATFRVKAGWPRFAVSVYASRKPLNGLYYVRREVKSGEHNTEVIFLNSLAAACSHLKKDRQPLESVSNALGKRGESSAPGACKRKENIL